MSWDSYIDNLIAQSKDTAGESHADKACIIGIDGAAWTTVNHPQAFKLTTVETSNIATCFKTENFQSMQTGGILCDGIKYQFLQEADKKLVLGKKKDKGSITMQKSKTAVVIGHCREGGQQGNVNKGVAVIAEYLESLNM